MADVYDGIYLEDHPPVRSQFRTGRRDNPTPVIGVHTAESGTDFQGPDPKAENVASFISSRSNAGSYHLIGDTDSIIQLVRFENEAYGSRGGWNKRIVHLSLAMNADDWGRLPTGRVGQFLDTAAQMAVIAGAWMNSIGLGYPDPIRLTLNDAIRDGASGFIDHARLDPRRRTDPGPGFPWDDFLARYEAQLAHVRSPNGGPAVLSSLESQTMELQRILLSWGAHLGGTGPARDGIDGVPGGRTIGSAVNLIRQLAGDLETTRELGADLSQRWHETQEQLVVLQSTNMQQASQLETLAATVQRLQDELTAAREATTIADQELISAAAKFKRVEDIVDAVRELGL